MAISKQQAIAEVVRRVQKEKARFYEPHSGQEDFHKCIKPIRAVFAGNRWGKTYSLAMECHWHASKTHPWWKPLDTGAVKIRACTKDYKTMKRSMIEDTFRILVPRHLLKGGTWDKAWSELDKVLRYENGSFIEFMSYDQDVEAYGGTARHVVWEDEEAPELIHRENMARLISTKGILIMSMTPVRPQMWVVSDIYEKSETDDRIAVFTGISTENPYVDADAVDLMLSQINDPVEREARFSGKFSWYAGKIYPQYGDTHRIDFFTPPKEWDMVVAIDPHDTKETAVTFNFWEPKGKEANLYVLDEIWRGGGWREICDEIKMKCARFGQENPYFIIDPSSDRDPKIHETESIYKKFQAYFPNIQKWLMYPGSVWTGVEDVRGMLVKSPVTNLPKLFVANKNCPMTDWQLGHYGLKPPTAADQYRYQPKPVQVKDDFCDCARGVVMFGPPTVGRVRPVPEEEDKFGVGGYDG